MKFSFPTQDIQQVLHDVGQILAKRSLGDIVSLQGSPEGEGLQLIFEKLGRSVIELRHRVQGNELFFEVASEKIAWAHRPFRDDITKKFMDVVQKAGGKVLG